ncbi:GNAT family N-acetyltransferase [Roseovarius aestuariivivens]|uniref:GNAT family N-acetyltransferase n=1 Tax=Roseovarius aestuariivivens TaxID=1888910 RepID=UPI0010813716|nr:GNAT family N-acetyltransferase [Roseovarius aestuariivivens]
MLIVEPADPAAPGSRTLLEQSHALMRDLFPPEDNYFLDINALRAPDIRFFAAREGDKTLGTGALALRPGYGEVKSMFTAPEARGKGVGRALLRQIEDEARALSLPVLRLETAARLEAAVRLYEGAGFAKCEIFGDYRPNETSLYMEKRLI